MRLMYAAVAATALVIVVGFAMISPLFFPAATVKPKQRLMLSFSVTEQSSSALWCQNLSSILNRHNIGATVFIVGRIAEEDPQTVLSFSEKVDIGSQTYSNANLTGISNYSLKLQEVAKGKEAVDKAGNLDSKVFRAPYLATDGDIYSLLGRNNITVDFSYSNQYNVYRNGQFVRIEATTYSATDYEPGYFINRHVTDQPIILSFDNSCSIARISSIIDQLVGGNFEFINASELTGLNLTIRGA